VCYNINNRSHRASDSSVPWWAFLFTRGDGIMKDPKTIDQQVQILINRGLIINNIELAKEFLNQVNYYRFSGYLKLFYTNDIFDINTSLEDIIEIYNFDCELRKILYSFLGYIEVLIKTQLALHLSLNINAIFYLDKNNFLDEDRFNSLQNDLNDSITRKYSKEPFIKHFQGDYLPIWVLVEIMSFGNISMMYANLIDSNKDLVCKSYLNINKIYLKNYLYVLSNLRNSCAHHARIYGKEFELAPKISNKDKKILMSNNITVSNSNHKLFIYIFIMVKLIKDSSQINMLISELKALFNRYSNIEIEKIGFVNNWENILNSIK
jgi:abortive infection bacteriophage resistance protein